MRALLLNRYFIILLIVSLSCALYFGYYKAAPSLKAGIDTQQMQVMTSPNVQLSKPMTTQEKEDMNFSLMEQLPAPTVFKPSIDSQPSRQNEKQRQLFDLRVEHLTAFEPNEQANIELRLAELATTNASKNQMPLEAGLKGHLVDSSQLATEAE